MYAAPAPATNVNPASDSCADRTKRVKDAKSEAQKEIEDYRKQKDEEFKSFEQKVRPRLIESTHHAAAILTSTQHSSGNKQAEDDADKDTQKKVEEIEKIGKDTGPKVCLPARPLG